MAQDDAQPRTAFPDVLRREGETLRRETIARGLRILELERLLDDVQAKLRELLASFERLGEGDTGSASGNGSWSLEHQRDDEERREAMVDWREYLGWDEEVERLETRVKERLGAATMPNVHCGRRQLDSAIDPMGPGERESTICE